MKKLIIITTLLFGFIQLQAQCDESLIEYAQSKILKNEIFKKDFKVKLKEASIKEPAPVAKFNYQLENGKKYRLRIISDPDASINGILRLYHENAYLGTTYFQAKDKHYEFFDFICKKTDEYKVLVSIHNGKKGCAVAIITELKE